MRVQAIDPLVWMYVQPTGVQPVSGAEPVAPVRPTEASSSLDLGAEADRRPRDPGRLVDLRV